MEASNSGERTLNDEFVLLRFREKLRDGSVKLWLPPYYTEENKGQSEEEIKSLQDLSEKFCSELGIDKFACYETLRYLQQNAVEKLQERSDFDKTGVARIRVKVSGGVNGVSQKTLCISTKLDVPVSDVHTLIGEKLSLPVDRIKLISSGQVLKTEAYLCTYGVRNGSQLMAVVIAECSREKLRAEESRLRTVQQTRDDISVLTNNNDEDIDPYLQIADQAGNTLFLPPEEKRSLVTAMTLHEKGRAALKKNDYALALVLLLEADKEFSSCRSQLLEGVDNFALLNLDIAWCYLCLENLALLPDAEERLKQCESKFKYSYGPNLERIVKLKGSAGNESTLLMRLHLLQGIVLFHQNKTDAALLLLSEAKTELADLKLWDSNLSILLEMGFTAAEGRFGLRATKGNVDEAVAYIQRRRQEYDESRKRDILNRAERKLGKCANGIQYVSEELVKQLVSMGFDKRMVVEALRMANNTVAEAITLINERPAELSHQLLTELITQLSEAGFLPTMAKLALRKHNMNVEKAIDELTKNDGIIDGEVSDEDLPSTSSVTKKKTLRDLKMEQEAFKRISEDIPSSEIDEYLDTSLEQEEEFLYRYLSMIKS